MYFHFSGKAVILFKGWSVENAGGIKILLSSVSFDVITINGTLSFSVALKPCLTEMDDLVN